MPYIRVELQKMQQTSNTLLNISKEVGKIEDSFRRVSRKLDWDVKCEQDIDWRLKRIGNELEEEERMLRSMKEFLDYTISRYTELERQSMREGNRANKIKNGIAEIVSDKNLVELHSDLLDKITKMFKGFSELMDNDSGGFTASILEYSNDFIQMFTGGDGKKLGIVRWCNLVDSSSGLWKGFYEIIKDGIQNQKDQDLFEKKFGDTASVVGMVGSFASFMGAYIQFARTGTLDGYGDMTKSIVGVGKEIYLAAFEPKSSYPAHTYTSIIKSGVDFTVQVGKSVKKYKQDGEWSMKDTGVTGIEASITGLNTLISGYTYGIISLENFGTSPEEVSEIALSGAENWGTKAGEMIRDDPFLKKEYDEAGSFKKTRMLLWAIGKTVLMALQA